MSSPQSSAKWPALLLLIAAGVLLTFPFLHYQDFLSQGDHGRDLYAFEAVYRGELPYRDFWWVYGPLMPYYYGLFFKIFGVHISSAILGKAVLRITGGVFIYLALAETGGLTAAWLAGCWFILFHQDFFFTYNHIGGIAMITAIAFSLLAYIHRHQTKFAFRALGFMLVLGLIKINFGLAALAVILISVAVTDKLRGKTMAHKNFYLLGLLGIPLVLLGIYCSLLQHLSIMEIRQCLPYWEDDQPYNTSPWIALYNFALITWHGITSNWMNTVFALIIVSSLARTIFLLVFNRLPSPRKIILILTLGALSLFYIANFHEYIKSGVWYRAFWSQPLSIMLCFVVIDTALASVHKIAKVAVFGFMIVLAAMSWYPQYLRLKTVEVPSQSIGTSRADIYTTNAPAWNTTVRQTTDFLNATLKPNELFFALPYDCLYYYLTGKKTPTRQLIFFEHIKIPAEQERAVIADLERRHVNYVLISSRAYTHQEYGLGMFGQTYCPLLAQYLVKNFTVKLAHFGDWSNEPGWAWNHGTLILKRKGT